MTPFWKNWLTAWRLAVLAFGIVLAAAAIPALDGPARWFYDLVHWPVDGRSSFDENVRFTCGILGAVTIGWALTIFAAIEAAEKLGAPVWRALTRAILVWYALDSAISIATGAPVNAISNTVLLATYLAPVLASKVLAR